jgi:hypothetical protein
MRPAILAVCSLLCFAASASAETMRCQSINGNLNCAGSGGVSCQTVDGRKVCVSGHGDVVQSFGGGGDTDEAAGGRAIHRHGGRADRFGSTPWPERDGMRPDLPRDWLSPDQD